MSRYAEDTSVSSDRSRAEIEKILARYGASRFMYGWDEQHHAGARAIVQFTMGARNIKFLLPLPGHNDDAIALTPGKRRARSAAATEAAYDQAVRQRWRALLLVIKAKLEAVETGITEFEDEFMAHILMPDGKTVGEHVRPQITLAYDSGKMPKMLPQF